MTKLNEQTTIMNKLLISMKALLCVSLYLAGFGAYAQGADNETKTSDWYKSHEWLNGLTLNPHASVNEQEFSRQYQANKQGWDKAFEFLKTTDLDGLAPGRYPIDEGNVFAMVSEVAPLEMEQVKWEAHRNFNDLQYIVQGKAKMGVAPVDQANVIEPYDSQKDIAFYDAEGEYYDAEPGTFFIFSPQEAHRPAIKMDGYDQIKRIVIKVRSESGTEEGHTSNY